MGLLTFHTADVIARIRSEKRCHLIFKETRREQYYQGPNLPVVIASTHTPDVLHLISEL